jgi:hypothetical protein
MRATLRAPAAPAGALGPTSLPAACAPSGAPSDGQPAYLKNPVTLRLGERAGTEEQAFDNRVPVAAQKYPPSRSSATRSPAT